MVTIVNFGGKMDLNNGAGSGNGSGSNSSGLKPSLGINNRTIQTSHYFGPNYQGSFNDFNSNPGRASSGYTFAPSFAFHNPSSAKTWGALMEYGFHVTQMGNNYLINSSNVKMAVPESDWQAYGPNMTVNRDDIAENIGGWHAATNGSHAIEYAKPNQEVGLFQMPEHTPNYSNFGMTDVRVPIKVLAGTVPLNKVGYYISKIANLEQDLREILFANPLKEMPGFNQETEAYLEFLEELGLGHPREIRAIGVQNLESAIAATYIVTDANTGKEITMLVADANLYQKANKIAEKQGLSGAEAVKFVKSYIWYHEFYHVMDHRKGLSEKKIETGIGAALAEFFGERASQVGAKIATYYRALAREGNNYALGWQEGHVDRQKAIHASELENMISHYISEAREKGLTGEEARDYVANKIDSELGKNTEARNMKNTGNNSKSAEAGVDSERNSGSPEKGNGGDNEQNTGSESSSKSGSAE